MSSTFSTFVFFPLFYYSHLMGVEWYHTAVLICIFPMANNVEYLFVYLFGFFLVFGEMSIQILCPFLNWVICHFIVELRVFSFILGTSFLYLYLFLSCFTTSNF